MTMARSKKSKRNQVITGAIMTAVGGLLVTPADEAIVAAATGGAGLAVAPAQLPVTGAIGSALVLTGIGLIVDGVK